MGLYSFLCVCVSVLCVVSSVSPGFDRRVLRIVQLPLCVCVCFIFSVFCLQVLIGEYTGLYTFLCVCVSVLYLVSSVCRF